MNKLASPEQTADVSSSNLGLSEVAEKFVTDRLKSIRNSLTLRGEKIKEKLIEEISPSHADSDSSASELNVSPSKHGVAAHGGFRNRLFSFLPENISQGSSDLSYNPSERLFLSRYRQHRSAVAASTATDSPNRRVDLRHDINDYFLKFKKSQYWVCRHIFTVARYICSTLDYFFPPFYKIDEPRFILWLVLVNLCFLYNMFTIFFRSSFYEVQGDKKRLILWLTADYFTDFVFLLDIFMHFRCRFLHNGLYITDPRKMKQNYMKTSKFKADLIALIPFDLLYLKYGIWPIFRLNRVFKYPVLPQLFDLLDIILLSSYVVRITRIVLYLLLLINLKACCFYAASRYEGFGINDWVYDGKGNAYLRCFYFGLKTSTGIGNNETANNNFERIYMTIIWLIGTFSIALFIAQVRQIVEDSRRTISDFRNAMDKTITFMVDSNIPTHLINRVRLWLLYTWKTQKSLDDTEFLDFLSLKMQTDIAISVHYDTLSKVKLFQDCERNLLRDLVLKLRPVIYLPGDYICNKGEIGKEMYIIDYGIVEVTIGREPNLTVLATLREGSVFGEIGLLAITGENRRTANVRSKGFSNIFVLSKENLEETLKEYPEAKVLLEKKAKKILRAQKRKTVALAAINKSKKSVAPQITVNSTLSGVSEDEVKVKAITEPKLIETVLKIMDPASKVVQRLRQGEHFILEHPPPPPATTSDLKLLISSPNTITPFPYGQRRSLTSKIQSPYSTAIVKPQIKIYASPTDDDEGEDDVDSSATLPSDNFTNQDVACENYHHFQSISSNNTSLSHPLDDFSYSSQQPKDVSSRYVKRFPTPTNSSTSTSHRVYNGRDDLSNTGKNVKNKNFKSFDDKIFGIDIIENPSVSNSNVSSNATNNFLRLCPPNSFSSKFDQNSKKFGRNSTGRVNPEERKDLSGQTSLDELETGVSCSSSLIQKLRRVGDNEIYPIELMSGATNIVQEDGFSPTPGRSGNPQESSKRTTSPLKEDELNWRERAKRTLHASLYNHNKPRHKHSSSNVLDRHALITAAGHKKEGGGFRNNRPGGVVNKIRRKYWSVSPIQPKIIITGDLEDDAAAKTPLTTSSYRGEGLDEFPSQSNVTERHQRYLSSSLGLPNAPPPPQPPPPPSSYTILSDPEYLLSRGDELLSQSLQSLANYNINSTKNNSSTSIGEYGSASENVSASDMRRASSASLAILKSCLDLRHANIDEENT